MNRIIATLAVVASAAGLGIAQPAQAANESPQKESPVMATFEGETFDMSQGWGTENARPEIKACHVAEQGTICYRSERAMNKAVGIPSQQSSSRASCSSSLRLYDRTSWSGPVLYLSARNTLISLSWYGFNNRTSSYRVGGCSARLYSGIGSGTYGGNTSAWASASSMWWGWSNVVSSAYIY